MSAPTGITELSGGVVLCQDAHALSERRGRAMLGRVCRDYLDENVLIPIELLHHSGHAKLLNNAENLYAALVQKAAVAQAQASNSPVRDKVKKLYAITTAAVTQVEAFEKKLPGTPLTHRLLAQLTASRPAVWRAYRLHRAGASSVHVEKLDGKGGPLPEAAQCRQRGAGRGGAR